MCWNAVSTCQQRFQHKQQNFCLGAHIHLFCLLTSAPFSVFVCRNGEKVYKLATGNCSSSFDFPHFNTNQPRSFSLCSFYKNPPVPLCTDSKAGIGLITRYSQTTNKYFDEFSMLLENFSFMYIHHTELNRVQFCGLIIMLIKKEVI